MRIGEFAKKTGVTIKTLLHYDKRGILLPSNKTDAGYRIYTDSDILRLQQITTLKFIGLSITEIKILLADKNKNINELISIQKIALEETKQHLEIAINALQNAEVKIEENGFLEVQELIDIIKVMDIKAKVTEQYKTSEKFKLRTNLHSYNINKTDWNKWCFNQMEIPSKAKILEIGSGTGELWSTNFQDININWLITLSDHSNAMLQKTKEGLEHLNQEFIYKTIDAQNIPYDDESFDIVIARHMMYLVPDIEKALLEIRRVLVKGGTLYLTTNSCETMKELNKMVDDYDLKIGLGNNGMCQRFECEDGEPILKKYFSEVKMNTFDGEIIVDESEPIVLYKASTTKGSKILVGDKKEDFRRYVDEYIKKNKKISITTKACSFEVKK